MAEKLRPTHITRQAWDFMTDHLSSLIKIIAIPLIISIALEGFIEIYYAGTPSPYIKAGVDGFYAVVEALWGVRWLRYLLEPPRQNQYFMAPFRFGKHEVKYALYGLALISPVMLDDITVHLPLPGIARSGLLFMIFLSIFIILRFEFIFPAIAISHNTGFRVSWQKSKAYWGRMIISFLQSLIIMMPVIAVLSLIGFGLFVFVWVSGFADISNWTVHNGFDTLFLRSPTILGIYLFIKESAWIIGQALILTIVGLYYRDASVNIVSKKT